MNFTLSDERCWVKLVETFVYFVSPNLIYMMAFDELIKASSI